VPVTHITAHFRTFAQNETKALAFMVFAASGLTAGLAKSQAIKAGAKDSIKEM